MKNSKYFYQKFAMPVPPVADREKCKGCGQPRRIMIWRDMTGWYPGNGKKDSDYPATGWQYLGYGHFCTQTCATRWANQQCDKYS